MSTPGGPGDRDLLDDLRVDATHLGEDILAEAGQSGSVEQLLAIEATPS
jgi:hypothetical protein